MAITAANAIVVHAGLDERSVNEILIPDLAIVMVNWIGQQLQRKEIVVIASALEVVRDSVASGMALGTGFDLSLVGFCLQPGEAKSVIAIPEW